VALRERLRRGEFATHPPLEVAPGQCLPAELAVRIVLADVDHHGQLAPLKRALPSTQARYLALVDQLRALQGQLGDGATSTLPAQFGRELIRNTEVMRLLASLGRPDREAGVDWQQLLAQARKRVDLLYRVRSELRQRRGRSDQLDGLLSHLTRTNDLSMAAWARVLRARATVERTDRLLQQSARPTA
jgi:hypothetical protein